MIAWNNTFFRLGYISVLADQLVDSNRLSVPAGFCKLAMDGNGS